MLVPCIGIKFREPRTKGCEFAGSESGDLLPNVFEFAHARDSTGGLCSRRNLNQAAPRSAAGVIELLFAQLAGYVVDQLFDVSYKLRLQIDAALVGKNKDRP